LLKLREFSIDNYRYFPVPYDMEYGSMMVPQPVRVRFLIMRLDASCGCGRTKSE
jgi:hypothetical protein